MAMIRIFLLMAALHGANVALAETEVKGRPALVLDGEAAQVVRGPEERGGFIEAEMAATLPLAGFECGWPRTARHYGQSRQSYRGCGGRC